MPRYVDLDNPKIIRGERDRFGLVVYHIPPDTPCLNLAERPKGRWIEYIPEHGKCQFCGNQVDLLNGKANNFCGECGADMRGEQE